MADRRRDGYIYLAGPFSEGEFRAFAKVCERMLVPNSGVQLFVSWTGTDYYGAHALPHRRVVGRRVEFVLSDRDDKLDAFIEAVMDALGFVFESWEAV